MNISIAPETIFYIGSFPVTNALFTGLWVVSLIILFSLIVRSKLNFRNPGNLQIVLEILLSAFLKMVTNVIPAEKATKLFGFLMTFFIFILFSNWFGLLPIVPAFSLEQTSDTHATQEIELITPALAETTEATEAPSDETEEDTIWDCLQTRHCYLTTSGIREFHEATHVFRAPTTSLSLAIALAIISVVMTNYYGFQNHGINYGKKYINFSNPINGFVGILEIVSELGKVVSFSFRLFGNIFAGEILLLVITGITLGLATAPFLILEFFIGFIQAFVFFILTAVFIGSALSTQEH